MNFLSSHPSVEGTVGWDGLQLQARTAPGSGRCLHRCTLVLCPCIAAGGGTEYEQGTATEGYDRGTIALGTEKVQTEVQKQSEGSGNQG